MENGYLYVSGEWKEGDLLKLRFAMKVKVNAGRQQSSSG